jgi:hypothetical protein
MKILLPIASVFAVLACHWFGLLIIRPTFQATLSRLGRKGAWGEDLSLAVAILMLIIWLFLDVALCAAIIGAIDGGVGFPSAFLFAIASFTTVGSAPPTESDFWSLAGPLTAMSGIFIFGWTTSYLVEFVHAIRDFRNTQPTRPDITKR